MIFGDRSRFSVCFELNEDHGGVWMLGKVCFYIGDIQVGDYEGGDTLRDALFAFENILKGSGRRRNDRLFALPVADLWARLDRVFFLDADPEETRIANEEQWAWHLFIPKCESFDGWKLYLVENHEIARMLYGRPMDPGPRSVTLRAGEADEVLAAAAAALDRMYVQQGGES